MEPKGEHTPPRPGEPDRRIFCVPIMMKAKGRITFTTASPSRRYAACFDLGQNFIEWSRRSGFPNTPTFANTEKALHNEPIKNAP
jgi:hypothetical protein